MAAAPVTTEPLSRDSALDKAMEVFCERGIANTSMREVAA